MRSVFPFLGLALFSTAAATSSPLPVTDGLGRVTLNAEPRRIIAMLPSHTATWPGLGGGNRLAAPDRYSNSAEMAAPGCALTRVSIEAGEHDLTVLDEFTSPLNYGWMGWPEVKATLKGCDPRLYVVSTGRGALPELMALTGTVNEIQPIKPTAQVLVHSREPRTE
ncbi:cob(I)yrinic acid a,c-diamide adenosyltransferase [Deinococcus oregonensis]|uniref:Cob(I)yrinic acid a,c-diamide adenosyltransferase n=1 Tax=Deinococcus oregonensis TaxID=1805970 RepID=A0ABV6ATX2_9DEIO